MVQYLTQPVRTAMSDKVYKGGKKSIEGMVTGSAVIGSYILLKVCWLLWLSNAAERM